jgi:hypothetical protein
MFPRELLFPMIAEECHHQAEKGGTLLQWEFIGLK